MLTERRTREVTHQQIADELGISRQLVTHALNGTHRSRISEETSREIRRVARKLNYQPRNLTTHNIGYLLPIDNSYLEAEHTFSLHVERIARSAGYRLVTIGVQDASELDVLAETFNPKTVDGVISSRWYGGKLLQSLPRGVPLVMVSGEDDIPPQVDVVTTDVRATVAVLAEYLLGYGHERIGLTLSASDAVKQHRDIVRGARDALQGGGLPDDSLVLVRGEADDVATLLEGVLIRPNAPTAWIASSSTYATATLIDLSRHGFYVPETASVASLMDSPTFSAFPVPLTATTAFGVEIAEKAVERLVEKIKGTAGPARQEHLAAQIVERTSVAAPSGKKCKIQQKESRCRTAI